MKNGVTVVIPIKLSTVQHYSVFKTMGFGEPSSGAIQWTGISGAFIPKENTDSTDPANQALEACSIFLDQSIMQRFRIIGTLPPLGKSINFQVWVNGAMAADLGTITNASDDGFGNGFIANDNLALAIPAGARVAYRIDGTNVDSNWGGSLNVVVIDRKEEN